MLIDGIFHFSGWDTPTEENAKYLLKERKEYQQLHESLISEQKKTKDREHAKFLKEEAREALKMYRAACLLIPWYTNDYPGDCKVSELRNAPKELLPYMCRLEAFASII